MILSWRDDQTSWNWNWNWNWMTIWLINQIIIITKKNNIIKSKKLNNKLLVPSLTFFLTFLFLLPGQIPVVERYCPMGHQLKKMSHFFQLLLIRYVVWSTLILLLALLDLKGKNAEWSSVISSSFDQLASGWCKLEW